MSVLFFVVPLPGLPVLRLNAENSSRANEEEGGVLMGLNSCQCSPDSDIGLVYPEPGCGGGHCSPCEYQGSF